jgi:ACT domain-containing protein
MSINTACQHYGISRQAYYKQAYALHAKASTANKVVQLVRDQRIKLPQLGNSLHTDQVAKAL